jgi:hypothetical protein
MPTVLPGRLFPDPFYESDAIRAVAKINGSLYSLVSYDITLNVHGAADTASIVIPISSAGTDFSWELGGIHEAQYPNQDVPIYVQIWAGFPQNFGNSDPSTINGMYLRFFGIVDQYTAVFEQDQVTFQCRSLAAPLLTEKIQAPFGTDPTQTVITNSSTTVDLVNYVAKKYGLVNPATGSANVSLLRAPLTMQQVLSSEFETGLHLYSVWALLLQCAMQDDVDVWVDTNGVLWYYASQNIPRTNVSLKWGRDFSGLTLNHALQFSKNIEVRVHSYTPQTRTSTSYHIASVPGGPTVETTPVSKTVTSTPLFGLNQTITQTTNPYDPSLSTVTSTTVSGGATTQSVSAPPGSTSGKQVYEYWMPNLTQAQCADQAAKIYRQILLQEYQVSMKLPVTKSLLTQVSITSLISIIGIPYSYAVNNGLWPRQLRETLSATGGWMWEIDATSVAPPQGGV